MDIPMASRAGNAPLRRWKEIGNWLTQSAEKIIGRWEGLVTQPGPSEHAEHRDELRDSLPEFLCAMGRELAEGDRSNAESTRAIAARHGEQRWQLGWSLEEVISDFQALRHVLIEELCSALDPPLTLDELLVLQNWLDAAILAAAGACSREQLQSQKQSEDLTIRLNQQLERRVAQRTALAERRTAQLRKLAFELTQTEHRERRRFVEMLHEDLQQQLVAARLRVDVLRKPLEQSEYFNVWQDAAELLDHILETANTISSELSPPILHIGGLNAAFEWLVHWLSKRHGLEVELSVDREAVPTDSALSAFCFDATHELLLNVVQHSGTQQARLEVERLPDGQCLIRISDKGRGFQPQRIEQQQNETGLGLLSIAERIGYLGGRLEVDSQPGQGTTCRLIVPMTESRAIDGASGIL